MKMLLAVLALVVGLSPRSSAQVKDECDRFIGACSLEVSTTASGFDLWVSNPYSANDGSATNAKVTLMFSAFAEGWEYLYSHEVFLLSNGRSLNPKSEHDGRVGDGYVLEFITIQLTRAEFYLWIAGEPVEGRIGRTEFTLAPWARSTLQNFATQLKAKRSHR